MISLLEERRKEKQTQTENKIRGLGEGMLGMPSFI
jgi:hypothetical protein